MNKPERMENGTRAIARLDVRSRRVRAILAIGVMALYALAFIPLYYLAGPLAAALAIPPVAAAGWLLGMRAGVLAGLLVFLLHVLLLSLAGERGWHLMTGIGLPGSIVVVAMGAVVGGLRDLNEKMRREITERKRAEEELRKRTEQVIRHQTALLELTKLDYSDLESSLKRITEMDSKTLGVEEVGVWLSTKDYSEVVCEDLYKLSENLHGKGLRFETCDYPRHFQALKDDRVITADDACTDPRTSELSEYLKSRDIISMMNVPVRLYGKLVGVVAHGHVGLRREWTLEEQYFAASIADIVALTLENSARKRAEEGLRERTEQVIRHQTALLELTKLDHSDLDSALKGITEMDSKTLGVEQVSVWLLTEDHSAVICEYLYKLSENLHEKGLRLETCDYPRYFQALEDGRAIVANDACTDPRTSELSDGYLKPFGITSMMDVSVRLHGKLVAIVCHEHLGPGREWTLEEQDFAASIADMVSLTLESSERKRAEEELQKRLKELEIHYRVTMGRESRIIELKHQVNQLCERLGEEKKYNV